ncbi:MAG: hypothetical protein ACEQSU_13350 [Microgenomates group bacterium]|jgi:hypothetical protein
MNRALRENVFVGLVLSLVNCADSDVAESVEYIDQYFATIAPTMNGARADFAAPLVQKLLRQKLLRFGGSPLPSD